MALTLLERLESTVEGVEAMETCWDYPSRAVHTRDLTDFEDHLQDWGTIYGMAYVLARMEDPFESSESVAKRAFEAAKHVFEDYVGERLHRPPAEREEVAT